MLSVSFLSMIVIRNPKCKDKKLSLSEIHSPFAYMCQAYMNMTYSFTLYFEQKNPQKKNYNKTDN